MARLTGALSFAMMYEGLIRNLTRLVSLTEEEASLASSLFSYRTFRKRQFILQEGPAPAKVPGRQKDNPHE